MLDGSATGSWKDGPMNTLSSSLLSFFVEVNAYPTLVVDQRLSLLIMNRDAQEAFRMKGGKPPRPGIPLEDILPGESCEVVRAVVCQSTKLGEEEVERNIAVDVTGKRFPVAIVPVMVVTKHGTAPGRAFIISLKMEGRRAKDQQATKLASLGEFAAGIAHELNTPLANISLIAENLLDDVKDEAVKKELRKILTQVEFSAKTVQEILAFARKDNPSFELVDLRKVVNESIEKLRLERKWRLKFEAPGDLPKVKADPFQLQEVFINIIRNAKEAMKDGGDIDVRILVSTDWVDVSITDTGEGIPEENLEKISQPFFTTKPHGQGVGLGLPICQRIVSNHKGEIMIKSKVGTGTTFTVRLPRGERI